MDHDNEQMPESPESTSQVQESEASDQVERDAQPSLGEEFSSQPEQLEIPEKYVGKSALDMIKINTDQEKYLSQVSSERSQLEKEKEELAARLQQLESERQQQFQSQPQQVPQGQQESDPYSWLDKELDENPKGAIRKLAEQQREEAKREALNAELQSRYADAQSYYYEQKKDNQDFAELEKDMQGMAQKFSPIIKPEFLNSRQAIEALYLLARGNNVDRYKQSAIESAKKAGNLARDEKRSAFSESSQPSKSGNSVPWDKLSVEEMEKLMPELADDPDEF